MMNRFLSRLPLTFFALTVVVTVLSWVGNVYEWGVNNLLCADGIRWAVANIIYNFTDSPIGEIILLLLGLSVLTESGFLTFWKSAKSIKQKRAMQITIVAIVVYCLTIFCLLFTSHAVLLSAFGTLRESAFQQGAYGLLLLRAIIAGNLYGYFLGTFSSVKDSVLAHTSLILRISPYFVTAFVASEFVGSMYYVFEIGDGMSNFIDFIVFYVPLFLYFADLYHRKL
jgi:p-aminobenzoyl-glutamate transporter AbgT